MDTIWNEADLKIPPLITVRVADVAFVKRVRTIFQNRKSPQNDILQDEFAHNAALLSRLMARRKNSFHNMSGFQFICKLNTATSRLLKVDLEKVLNNFFQTLPENLAASVTYEIPSRNSFDYTLLRIISVHKLYRRISTCCLESADYFSKLLRNNFFMETITLFLAVIAKLWDLTNKLGNTCTDMYGKLIKFRKYFPHIDSSNHFQKFEFPNQLDGSSVSSTTETESNPTDENTLTMQKESVQTNPFSAVSSLLKGQKSDDIGMAISRDSLKPVVDLSRIHNIDDIRRYFKKETEEREKSLNSCSTKYILKHEWLAIQKLVDRKIIANDHKKALSVFRKFITSKI